MSLLTRIRQLALKQETTAGTAVTLAAADAGFKVEGTPKLTIVRPTTARPKQNSGGNDTGIAEQAHTTLNFSARMAGKGAVGVPALGAALWPACGLGLTSQTFARTWTRSSWKPVSAGLYMDGRNKLGRGMMGSAKVTMTAGGMWTVEADLMGGFVADPTDVAQLAGVSYESAKPPIWIPGTSTPLTIDGQTLFKSPQMVLDLNNQVALEEDENSAGGYCQGYIGSGAATFTLPVSSLLAAGYDFFAKQSANTTFTLTAVLDGGTNNKITASATVQVMNAPDWDDKDGRLMENLVLGEVDDTLALVYA